MSDPLILVDPSPRRWAAICDAQTRRRREALGELATGGPAPLASERVEPQWEWARLIVGQTDMPHGRLKRKRKGRAIFNVETDFLRTIDYVCCEECGAMS